MRIFEITAIKPLTPQQALINALRQQKERVAKQLQAERDKQKKQKALLAIQQNNQVLTKLQNR